MAFYLKRNTSVLCSLVTDVDNVLGLNIVDESISFTQTSSINDARRNRLGGSDRSTDHYTSRVSPATFSFSTYLYSSAVGNKAGDYFLWQSLTNSAVTNSVSFTNSDVNQLPELHIWFTLGTGGNYRISNAVINSVTIKNDINGIPTLEWSGTAKSIIQNSANSPSTDRKGEVPNSIGKLTTISMSRGATNYNLALTDLSITISNNINWVSRNRLGKISLPEAHYTGTRTIDGSFSVYLKSGTNGSKDLHTDILTNLENNTEETFDLDISIGNGIVSISMPNCILSVPSFSIDEVVVLRVDFNAQKTTVSGDELTITFN